MLQNRRITTALGNAHNYVIINNLKLKSIEIILSPSEDLYSDYSLVY